MKANRIGLTAAAIAVLAGAAPGAADQSSALAMRAPAPAPAAVPERATQLMEEAESLFPEPKQWKKAARLLEQSAELRDANDPEAYYCLLYAGRIRFALGDVAGARSSLQKAAAQALARGSIVEAAHAYIDAAHAAVMLKDGGGAKELVDKAALLTESPLLSVEQRTFLKDRLSA